MKEARETFFDMLLGMAIYAVIVCIIGGIVVENKLGFILGCIYGTLIAGLLAYHMLRSLDMTLDLNPDDATKHARKMSLLRMAIMTVMVAISFLFPKYLHVIGVLLGVLALKIAAYLQPIIHRYITNKIYNKGR